MERTAFLKDTLCLRRTHIGAFRQTQFLQQRIHSALQCKEICIAAVHTNGQTVRLVGQCVRTGGQIFLADLIQCHCGIPVLVVGCQHIQHTRQCGRPHDAGVLAQRIGDGDGLAQLAVCRETDPVKALRRSERIGQCAVVSQTYHGLFCLPQELLLRCQLCLSHATDDCGRDVVVAVDSCNFLCDIRRALQVDPETGRYADIAFHLDIQGFQCLYHLFPGDLCSQETVDPIRIKGDLCRLCGAVVHFNELCHRFACAQQFYQFHGTFQCALAAVRIQTLFIPCRCVSTHSQFLCGAANLYRFKVSGLENNGIGVVHDAAVFAAHNTCNSDRLFCVGND